MRNKLVGESEWPKFLEERKQFVIEFDAAQKQKTRLEFFKLHNNFSNKEV